MQCARPHRRELLPALLSLNGLLLPAACNLQRAVDAMVKDAAAALAKMSADERPPPELQRPLIRLKVEHSGYGVLSNQRFGAM